MPANGGVHRRYWPALDGLRGVAVLLVLAYHLGYSIPRGGFVGVDVFFVLSGFLITTLLLDEFSRRGSIAFGAFYIRRGLRLLPALVVVSLFAVVLVQWRGTAAQQDQTEAGLPLVLLYVVNWAMALDFMPAVGWLGHTWSLAIEEQFYLLGPLLLLLLMKRSATHRRSAFLLLVASVVVIIYRSAGTLQGWSAHRLYMGLDTHSDRLLMGCALAFWLAGPAPRRRVSARLGAGAVVVLGGLAIAASFHHGWA